MYLCTYITADSEAYKNSIRLSLALALSGDEPLLGFPDLKGMCDDDDDLY